VSDTIATIKDVIARLRKNPELAQTLGDESDIVDEIGLDSLEMLQFMLELEEKLAVRINFDALEFSYLHSIRRLAEFLDTPAAIPAADATP
jgi:acyl carrier protein